MAVSLFDLTATGIIDRRLSELSEIGSTSKPTSTEATEILTQVGAYVNGKLVAAGFTLADITSSTAVSYGIVRRTIEYGFCADFLQAVAGAETEQSKSWRDMYEALLEAWYEDPDMLSDVYSPDSQSGSPSSHITANSMTDSGTLNTDITPPIRADDSW